MLDDFNQVLLSGGLYECRPAWSRAAGGVDRCFKLYLAVGGAAQLEFDDGRSYGLRAGRLYLISGFRLRRQICAGRFRHYWLHFVPEALYLRHLLDQAAPVLSWPLREGLWPEPARADLLRLFEHPGREYNRPRPDSAPATACRVQGLLLGVLARALATLEQQTLRAFHPEYYRLQPAIAFMDREAAANPPLARIAAEVRLAPHYFHRQFKRVFGVTPFAYMLARRLTRARHLLAHSLLEIKEVATAVGYSDALYFSRVFHGALQMTPSAYRAAARSNLERPGL